MTAIAGFALNSHPPEKSRLVQEALVAKLAARGPKGVKLWRSPEILLALAQSGPGSRNSIFDDSSTSIRVTGDMRIDNRADILNRLNLSTGDVSSDADLVAQAFMRWGTSSFEMLIGDFAFALWDDNDKTLYCCRDHFGVRPLFYEANQRLFAFASEAKMLPGFSVQDFSAEHLSNFVASIPSYRAETPFAGIFRLMPGHWLSYRDGAVTCREYWRLEIDPVEPADPVGEFRHLFEQAVADRMGNPDKTASLLSGGLDSSAITGVAGKVLDAATPSAKQRTYSIIYRENPLLDERQYINDLLSRGSYLPQFVEMDRYKPLHGAAEQLKIQEEPVNSPGLLKSSLLYKAAADEGIEVLLCGQGGDEVVGYGTGRLVEIAMAGEWLKLIPMVRTVNRLFDGSDLEVYQGLLEKFGSGRLHTRAARAALRPFVKRMTQGGGAAALPWERYLSHKYISAMELHQRNSEATLMTQEQRTNDQHLQLYGLRPALTGPAFELFDKAGAAAGLQMRFPFFDLRLVKFCLGLPSSEKLRRNETRSILKRAMADVYPPSIRNRQDKTNFLPELAVGMVKYHSDLLEQIATDSGGHLGEFMDMDKLRLGLEAYRRAPSETDGMEVQFFWRVAMLFIWLTSDSHKLEQD